MKNLEIVKIKKIINLKYYRHVKANKKLLVIKVYFKLGINLGERQ